MDMMEFLKTYVVPFGFKLILAIVILIVGFALASGLSKALRKSSALSKADPNAQNLIVNLVKIAIRVVTVFTAVIVLGVPQASVIAVLGSCGLAIGLALQGGLSNIAAGIPCRRLHHCGRYLRRRAGDRPLLHKGADR